MVMELEAVTSYCAMFYHKTKSLIPLCIPAYQKGGSTLSICAVMVRDIKENEDYTFLLKMSNEIEVNLFIFPDIKII
jgi:hypothetical protein